MTAAIVIISCLVVLALAANAILQQRKNAAEPQISSGTAEAMLGVIGTLFSVLLGLLVAGAIDRYHDVSVSVESEANGIGNIYRLAKGLEETDRKRIRTLCKSYSKAVVEQEWIAMREHTMSRPTQGEYVKLWDACISVNPTNERENNIHAAVLDSIDQVGADRRSRAVTCMAPVPLTLWSVIICGSLITICFTHLFTAHMGSLHWMMTTLVAISLGLNVWLLAAYSTPFQGDLALQPSGFELLRTATMIEDDGPASFLAPSEKANLYAKQPQSEQQQQTR